MKKLTITIIAVLTGTFLMLGSVFANNCAETPNLRTCFTVTFKNETNAPVRFQTLDQGGSYFLSWLGSSYINTPLTNFTIAPNNSYVVNLNSPYNLSGTYQFQLNGEFQSSATLGLSEVFTGDDGMIGMNLNVTNSSGMYVSMNNLSYYNEQEQNPVGIGSFEIDIVPAR